MPDDYLYTRLRIRERVSAGRAAIREKVPGYSLDLHNFDVGWPNKCPLAQVFGDYHKGRKILGIAATHADNHEDARLRTAELGFCGLTDGEENYMQEYVLLNAEWIRQESESLRS